jgi:hypothetical protein
MTNSAIEPPPSEKKKTCFPCYQQLSFRISGGESKSSQQNY